MSKNRAKRLSSTDMALVDIINKFPGLTPMELHKHTPGIQLTSMSAITSRLTTLKKVNRLKVPMSATYRYYPKDAELPNGYAQWNNTLVRVVRTKKGNGPDVAAPPAVAAAQPDLFPAKPEPNPTIVTKPTYGDVGGVLITLEAGKDSITLTFEQAYRIWQQLDRMFGPK